MQIFDPFLVTYCMFYTEWLKINSIANHPTLINVMSIGCCYGAPWYISDPYEYRRIYGDPLLHYGSPWLFMHTYNQFMDVNSFIMEIHNSVVEL